MEINENDRSIYIYIHLHLEHFIIPFLLSTQLKILPIHSVIFVPDVTLQTK